MSAPAIVPGSWRLGSDRFPWPTSTTTGLTVAAALTLSPNADGPRSLRSPNQTLGGLVLPPTLATDAGIVWLLNREDGSLRRFDPVAECFVTVEGWGAQSSGAHRFGRRASIAATGGHLAVADPDRGDMVVIATGPLVVQTVLNLAGRHPVAIAGHAGRFHVLDDRGRLLTTTLDHLVPEPESGAVPPGSWRRVAVDAIGRVCRVDDVDGSVLAPAPGGGWELFYTADQIRSRFPEPALAVDRLGRFTVPAEFRLPGSGDSQTFDNRGHACEIEPGEYAGEPPYEVQGTWTSQPLDSGTLGCRWHRLTLTGTRPPRCTTTVETYTSDKPIVHEDVPPDAWSRAHVLDPVDAGGPASPTDFAVLSPRGRYLALRIGLRGDGWATPSVEGLLVEPEANGIERFLPAVYRTGDEADFLRRFLAIFGTELDKVENALHSLPGLFSPTAVPEARINTLAAELGVPLERDWTPAQRRAMLEAAPRWHRSRGTPAAIRALLRIHLEASVGHRLPESLPALVEGFRERPAALIGGVTLPMVAGQRTWSDDVVDRPVLGRPRADRISLVSVGERQTDRFREHANRFKVFMPRALLPREEDRESFERLIVSEKPAHVAHQLVLVEARAVVGEQAFLGVDTFVGAWPDARLANAGGGGSPLGLGLRLANRGPAPACPPAVGRGNRVGVSTVLI